MEKDTYKTKVIFRKFSDGDVVALFPEIPDTYDITTCMSYLHIGQHGGATVFLTSHTKPASLEEYKDLFNELENQIGYNLKVIKRFHPSHREARKKELEKVV